MKMIPETFSLRGMKYRLLERTDKKALYEQQSKEFNIITGYEVHIIRHRKGGFSSFAGKKFVSKDREILAGDEEFGKYAWTFPGVSEAREFFESPYTTRREWFLAKPSPPNP